MKFANGEFQGWFFKFVSIKLNAKLTTIHMAEDIVYNEWILVGRYMINDLFVRSSNILLTVQIFNPILVSLFPEFLVVLDIRSSYFLPERVEHLICIFRNTINEFNM